MRLLDLVEQYHPVGAAADRLGQLAAFLEADVARRRADQSGDGVLFLVFAHVQAHHRVLVVEEETRQRARQFRLTDAGGAQEHEAADRPLGIGQPGAAAADGFTDCGDRLCLIDHAFVDARLHLEQALRFALHHLGDRDTGPLGHQFRDVLLADLAVQAALFTRRQPGGALGFVIRAGLGEFRFQGRRAFVVLRLGGLIGLPVQLIHALL